MNNKTEATNSQITGQEFYEAALGVSYARDELNKSSSGYGGSFFAIRREDAVTAMETLQRLISDRKDQIANAEYQLELYRIAVRARGPEAYLSDQVSN